MRSMCLLGVQVHVAAEGKGWMVFAKDNYDYQIMAYFERKGCIQWNLYLNCVLLQKGFEG